jgi:hypothetical protein
MFAIACSLARKFTRPVIVSTRTYDGSVSSGCAAFVVVNHDGWIVTVAHLWEAHHAAIAHRKEIAAYEAQIQAIRNNTSLTGPEQHAQTNAIPINPRWITHSSFWWGWDGVSLRDVRPLPEADLILARLEPYDPKWVTTYPTFKKPSKNFDQGTSLCRLGFPFHNISSTFDVAASRFILDSSCMPPPAFPIEGIYTRNIIGSKTANGRYDIMFIETSSPGLRGQSGGPIFDTHGTVWGLQSRTRHLPLGFSPQLKRGTQTVEEHQFLNVGKGIHAGLILSFLRDNGVTVQESAY